MKHTYYIKGMSCQGCRNHVEQSLAAVEGVRHVAVDLEKEEAEIEFETHISLKELQRELSNAGGIYTIHQNHPSTDSIATASSANSQKRIIKSAYYYCPMQCEGDKLYNEAGDCPICGMDLVPSATAETEEDSTVKALSKKLQWSLLFTIPIFLIAMSEMLPDNPLFRWMPQTLWNWIQLVLSLPVVFYSAWFLFERAYRSIISWNPNMFTLIGIGAGIAWVFSVVALITPDVFPDQFKTESGTVHVYFEAATVILTLVLLGQVLEARAHSRTSSAIRELLQLAPNVAIKLEDGVESEVRIESIKVGDHLRVKPGDKIPVDGFIVDGIASIDESMISGEAIPVVKNRDDKLIGGTINGNLSFLMEAEKVGSDTLLSQIIEMVNNASRSRAPIQNLADIISGYFVPAVVVVSIITFLIWAIWGPSPSYIYALVNAIAVLIIAC
ncbi:MAG: HAD-IC family P-type ATPase, partial [Flavobacteriaceae bacterium]